MVAWKGKIRRGECFQISFQAKNIKALHSHARSIFSARVFQQNLLKAVLAVPNHAHVYPSIHVYPNAATSGALGRYAALSRLSELDD
jgi:hypothetical protein